MLASQRTICLTMCYRRVREWDAVFAYAEARPECVTEEQLRPAVPTLDEAKALEINAAADRTIACSATYPDREIGTFDKQESEARDWTADKHGFHAASFRAGQARGIPLSDLVGRVLAKADAFAVTSGSIIGQRQALEDRLDACTTLEEVGASTVSITMPGGGEAA